MSRSRGSSRTHPERDIVRRTARGLLVVGDPGRSSSSGSSWSRRSAAAFDAVAPGRRSRRAARSSAVLGSIPFLIALSIAGGPGHLPDAAAAGAALAFGARSRRSSSGSRSSSLSQIFTFLVPRLVGVAALAGSLASAFIALAWLSFTFQALLYGAAWVRVRDECGEPGRQPAWGVPQRRQNRAVAESDSPQLTHGWTPPAGLARPVAVGDLAVRLGPEGLEAALRRGRPSEERQAVRRRHARHAAGPATAARRSGRRRSPRPGAPAPGRRSGAVGGRVGGDHLPGRLRDDVRRRRGRGRTRGRGSGRLRARAAAARRLGSGSGLGRRPRARPIGARPLRARLRRLGLGARRRPTRFGLEPRPRARRRASTAPGSRRRPRLAATAGLGLDRRRRPRLRQLGLGLDCGDCLDSRLGLGLDRGDGLDRSASGSTVGDCLARSASGSTAATASIVGLGASTAATASTSASGSTDGDCLDFGLGLRPAATSSRAAEASDVDLPLAASCGGDRCFRLGATARPRGFGDAATRRTKLASALRRRPRSALSGVRSYRSALALARRLRPRGGRERLVELRRPRDRVGRPPRARRRRLRTVDLGGSAATDFGLGGFGRAHLGLRRRLVRPRRLGSGSTGGARESASTVAAIDRSRCSSSSLRLPRGSPLVRGRRPRAPASMSWPGRNRRKRSFHLPV